MSSKEGSLCPRTGRGELHSLRCVFASGCWSLRCRIVFLWRGQAVDGPSVLCKPEIKSCSLSGLQTNSLPPGLVTLTMLARQKTKGPPLQFLPTCCISPPPLLRPCHHCCLQRPVSSPSDNTWQQILWLLTYQHSAIKIITACWCVLCICHMLTPLSTCLSITQFLINQLDCRDTESSKPHLHILFLNLGFIFLVDAFITNYYFSCSLAYQRPKNISINILHYIL